jgi:Tfp pilus assembly protein PilX
MAEWINIVTAIVSVGALGVALWSAFISRGARDAAKRSADAAEKAVQTAEQSLLENVRVRKINQFDILSPHFTNVDHLLKRGFN